MKMIKSFFSRVWNALDQRVGLETLARPLLDHPIPPNLGWGYVLGSATLVAFIVQALTGIALATAYIPSTQDAYTSLQFITREAPFGNFLRALHYFGASAMVILIGLHALQVYVVGAYKFPREVNWLSGVGLLGATLALAFTGQLLRWDQNAVWSVVVAAAQAGRIPLVGTQLARFVIGGETLGGQTLSRFFAFHVFFGPAVVFGLVGLHVYLILRHGIAEVPQAGEPVEPSTYSARYRELLEKFGRPFYPDFAWRDIAFGAGLVLVLTALALIFGPPALSLAPDPTLIEATPRPDWYFLWYFAVLAKLPRWLEDLLIPLIPLALGGALLLLPFFANKGERSPWRRPWVWAVVIIVIGVVGTFSVLGETSEWSPNFEVPEFSNQIIGAASGPVYDGALVFRSKACIYCHAISGIGGTRGPDLTRVGARLSRERIIGTVLNGIPPDMPAFGTNMTNDQLDALTAFLESRK